MEFPRNFIGYLIEYFCIIENYSIIIPGFIHEFINLFRFIDISNLIRYELRLIKNKDF